MAQNMMAQMAWIGRGQSSYAYRILEPPYLQMETPHFDRVNAQMGCCGLGMLFGCSQVSKNYLPGIKTYVVPHFLQESFNQDEWKELVFRFNRGMNQFMQAERPWGPSPDMCLTEPVHWFFYTVAGGCCAEAAAMPHQTRLRTNVGPALASLCAELSTEKLKWRIEVKASLEMPLDGREMPPEAFLVLEGQAVSNNPMSVVQGMPGMPNMMGMGMGGGMNPQMGMPGMGMPGMMNPAMMQPGAFPGQPMPQ